jgi:hypothetical protein
MVNVVLVCIGNFQEYIITNITQLLRLGHNNVYVLTNAYLFPNFERYKNDAHVKMVDVDSLNDSYRYYERTNLDKGFRNGFWALASMRFFYIYEFMEQFGIDNVIHLENDVLVYYNCDEIAERAGKQHVYLPFDCYDRNIASIMYIPSASVFRRILDQYDLTINDMENFVQISKRCDLIQRFPIFPANVYTNPEIQFVSINHQKFGYLFDAAAMGQYLGGVDPRNQPGDTKGFVNETCVIKYNAYNFIWENKKPYIIINNMKFPIFNLHIHHKNLQDFI